MFFSKWKLHRRKDLGQFTEKSLPGVSILKPLVNSADPSLFANLETFFLLDYPKYEIIFCIQCSETEDSRLKMYVDSLRNKYPSVQSKVRILFQTHFIIISTFLSVYFSGCAYVTLQLTHRHRGYPDQKVYKGHSKTTVTNIYHILTT